jgi:hypothetical protein
MVEACRRRVLRVPLRLLDEWSLEQCPRASSEESERENEGGLVASKRPSPMTTHTLGEFVARSVAILQSLTTWNGVHRVFRADSPSRLISLLTPGTGRNLSQHGQTRKSNAEGWEEKSNTYTHYAI